MVQIQDNRYLQILRSSTAKLEKAHKKASSNTAETNTETSRQERYAGNICWFNYHYKAGIGFHLSCILWLTYYHNIFDKCKAVVINQVMLKNFQYFSFSEIAPNIRGGATRETKGALAPSPTFLLSNHLLFFAKSVSTKTNEIRIIR